VRVGVCPPLSPWHIIRCKNAYNLSPWNVIRCKNAYNLRLPLSGVMEDDNLIKVDLHAAYRFAVVAFALAGSEHQLVELEVIRPMQAFFPVQVH
jgi:hypothetical protein